MPSKITYIDQEQEKTIVVPCDIWKRPMYHLNDRWELRRNTAYKWKEWVSDGCFDSYLLNYYPDAHKLYIAWI
jgi:hypothetical protein